MIPRIFCLGFLLISGILPAGTAFSQQAGRVQELGGHATALDGTGQARTLRLQDAVFAGEQLSADTGSYLVIRLADDSLLTLGADSSLVLDEFIFDPSSRDGKSLTSVIRGIFKLTSGVLVQKNPDSMKIKLPAGALAIRGTTLAAEVQEENTLVVLFATLDPLTGELKESGHIAVQNIVEGVLRETLLTQAGYGAWIEGDGKPPSESFRVPADRLEKIDKALRGGGQGTAASRAAQVFGGYQVEASAEKNRVLYRSREEKKSEAPEKDGEEKTLTEEAQVLEDSSDANQAQISTDFSK